MSPDLFKGGMRRLTAGVSLITTTNGGIRHGLVATAVSSVSAEPPTLLVCINRTASAHDHIRAAGIICVNVLSDRQRPLADVFSRSVDRHRRFDHGTWQTLKTGAPALSGSEASFDCEIRQVVTYHSHSLFLSEIVGVELWSETLSPLIYLDGSYRQVGSPSVAA